jgi:hypothetical protein
MPTSFRQVFITFSIIALFVFGAISFIVSFQSENSAGSSILENELINRTYVSLISDISTQETNTNSSKAAFESEIPAPGFGSLIIFAIVGVAQTFTSIITTTYNVLIVLPISLLGVPRQIASILGSILMMSLIFLAWRVFRVGS